MVKIYYFNRLFPNNHLRQDDEKIIESIIEEIENGLTVSIKAVAEKNYTSQSSISRLAKRAGFNNFKELIFFLTNTFSVSSSNQLDSLPFVSANQEWDRIDECFTNAFSTKKIYLFLFPR